MADPRRKKGVPLIYILLFLILLFVAIWFLVGRTGGEDAAPAVSRLLVQPMAPATASRPSGALAA